MSFLGAFFGVIVAEIVLSFFDPDAKVFDKIVKAEEDDLYDEPDYNDH